MDKEQQHKAHPLRNIALVMAAIVLMALLVLPGFLAAWFSKWDNQMSYSLSYGRSSAAEVSWDEWLEDGGDWPAITTGERVRFCLLAPSGWVMSRSPAIRKFYNWEYHLSGGRDIHQAGDD
ncbi:MAG TPA: hypothetical protein VG733_04025 [Chthoniobacteraceae bacterium]|nr:hypothetical protein [Chthoniobacteraceae bacterium]